jgi:predicted DNA-binding protein
MEVNFAPEIEQKLNEIAARTGRPAAELVEDVIADYVDEMAETRALLDSRYDEMASGTVQSIDGEEAFARLREKLNARHGSA